MRRVSLFAVGTAASLTSAMGVSPAGSPCATIAPSSSTIAQNQVRSVRNQHRRRHERHKKKNKLQGSVFSVKWKLYSGNNYQLYEFRGHEREATENFARYKYDSEKDKYNFYTSNLNDFPAEQRLDHITDQMHSRWGVGDKGRGYDKMKMALAGLECYAELKQQGKVDTWLELSESGQEGFLTMCDAVMAFAGRVVHDHPNAIPGMIRAAAIADLMGNHDKSASMLRVTRVATERMEEGFSFGREKILDEVDTLHSKLGKLPDAWAKDKKLAQKMKFPYTRGINLLPFRPEESSWMNTGIKGDSTNPEAAPQKPGGRERFKDAGKRSGKKHMLSLGEDWM